MSSATRELSYEGVKRGARRNAADLAVFRKNWVRGVEFVGLHARRSRARKRIDPKVYAQIHRELLEVTCLLGAASDGDRRLQYANVVEMIEPWPGVEQFAHAESAMLANLYDQATKLGRQLNTAQPLNLGTVVGFLAKLVLALAVIGGLFYFVDTLGISLFSSVRLNAYWLWHRAFNLSQLDRVIIFVVVGACFCIWNVSRTRAS